MILIPPRMAERPRWGDIPIPWNVTIGKGGVPLFIVNDSHKHLVALAHDMCPLCGQSHVPGEARWFIGGPLSAFDKNGWYLDLPGHEECSRYALQVCPYLAAPHYARTMSVEREMKMLRKLPSGALGLIDETVIPERPPTFVLVAATDYNIKPNAVGLPYIRPLRPYIAVEFWQHGRRLPDNEGQKIADAALAAWSAEHGTGQR